MTDHMTIRDHLDNALGAVLTARVAAGRVEAPPIPDDAVHGALGSSGDYQQARVQVREALDALQGSVDGETWAKILRLEGVMNAALAEAVEVTWKLGWTAGSGARRRS